VLDVIAGAPARVRRFGLGEANEWRVTDLADDGATRFTVREDGRAVCRLTLQPPGAINARNALGVLLLAREVGVGWEEGAAALARLIDGVPAIRDYLVATTRAGDVIVIMSNGAFGGLPALVVAGVGAA